MWRFFKYLLDFGLRAWEWWRSAALVVAEAAAKIFAFKYPALIAIFTGIFSMVSCVSSKVTKATNALASIQMHNAAPIDTGSQGLAVANTLLPLDEFMILIPIYVSAVAAIALYRLIKSWIPTLGAGS